MLLRFRVSNFRSFGDSAEISLLAGSRDNSHENHLVALPGLNAKALRTSVVYGANGAGKSNLYRAIRFFTGLAMGDASRDGKIRFSSFAFADNPNIVSGFELTFLSDGNVYGYAIDVSQGVITGEHLAKLANGHMEPLYDRIADDAGSLSVAASGALSEKEKAQAFVGAGNTRSLLSVIKENIPADQRSGDVNAVISWFEGLIFVGPDDTYGGSILEECRDDEFKKFAEAILGWASGVNGLDVREETVPEDKLRQVFSKEKAQNVLSALQHRSTVHLRDRNGTEMSLESGRDGEIRSLELQALHRLSDGRVGVLGLGDESDGTKRLLNLLPALYDIMKNSRVCIIDEIDRSLHAILTRSVLRIFLSQISRGQLILTTHESSLLDAEIFRRDEIWFAEKDTKGMTRLYSLNDYKKRTQATIRDYYLEGRYGATPQDVNSLSDIQGGVRQ